MGSKEISQYINLGARLRAAREATGKSQREIATLANMPFSTYSNYENGNRAPKMSTLQSLATILGVSANDLLGVDVGEGYTNKFSKEIEHLLREFNNTCVDDVLRERVVAILRHLNQMFQEYREIDALTYILPSDEQSVLEVLNYVKGLTRHSASISQEVDTFVGHIQNLAIERINHAQAPKDGK